QRCQSWCTRIEAIRRASKLKGESPRRDTWTCPGNDSALWTSKHRNVGPFAPFWAAGLRAGPVKAGSRVLKHGRDRSPRQGRYAGYGGTTVDSASETEQILS